MFMFIFSFVFFLSLKCMFSIGSFESFLAHILIFSLCMQLKVVAKNDVLDKFKGDVMFSIQKTSHIFVYYIECFHRSSVFNNVVYIIKLFKHTLYMHKCFVWVGFIEGTEIKRYKILCNRIGKWIWQYALCSSAKTLSYLHFKVAVQELPNPKIRFSLEWKVHIIQKL